ncbi:MAG TPA: UPF0175 family protein [Ardenticatenaceae bacterium]|nr:UPF0175 family protein [Ardenticatenaceae bacterium]
MSTTKTVQINLRVPDAVVSDLDLLAEHDHTARVDVARQILLDGIMVRKRDLALRLYREGRVSKSRAAEVAGLSLWEMMDLIDRAEISSESTVEEAVEEVRRLVSHLH